MMDKSDTPISAGRRPNPRLVSQEDFTAVADLAFRHDPRKSLTRQISLYVGVSETTTERWVRVGGSPPPVE